MLERKLVCKSVELAGPFGAKKNPDHVVVGTPAVKRKKLLESDISQDDKSAEQIEKPEEDSEESQIQTGKTKKRRR